MARIILITVSLLLLVMAYLESHNEHLLIARLVIIIAFVWAANEVKRNGYPEMYWAFIAVTILFMPFISEQYFALSRSFIDVLALCLLLGSYHKICKKQSEIVNGYSDQ